MPIVEILEISFANGGFHDFVSTPLIEYIAFFSALAKQITVPLSKDLIDRLCSIVLLSVRMRERKP